MTSNQLRELFFRTGLPEAYTLAQAARRQEKRGKVHEADHPGHRPAGDKL